MGVVETQSNIKLSVDYLNPPLRMPDPELKECKSFYKNKFECRMFVPIDDNFDGWWKR